MASEPARVPENVPAAWKAIDIYVFSNGQENSPPRKYHLRIDDLSWWTSTLKYVGRSQYGSKHSIVDLYTLEGKKVVGPLELSNGASYVAVGPPDTFIDSGYEKYLIKASRSWEKRQAKKNETVLVQDETTEIDGPEKVSLDMISNDQKFKLQQESLLNTIISSVVDHQTSTFVPPQPLSSAPSTQNEASNHQQIKPTDKKRATYQRPTFIKKVSPNNLTRAPLTSSMKQPIKKKENIKPANVTISKPESDKISSANKSRLPMKSKMFKPMNKQKKPSIPVTVLSKVQEDVKEMKTASSIKIYSINDQNVLTKTADIDTAIENQDVVLVSNTNKNTHVEETFTPTNDHELKSQEFASVKPQLQYINTESPNTNNKTIMNHGRDVDIDFSHNTKNNELENNENTKDMLCDLRTQQNKLNPVTNKEQSADALRVPENMQLHELTPQKISVLTKNIFDDSSHRTQENFSKSINGQIKYPANTTNDSMKTATIPSKDLNINDLMLITQYGINHKLAAFPSSVIEGKKILPKEPTQGTSIIVYNTSVSGQNSNEQPVSYEVNNENKKNNETNCNNSNNIIKLQELQSRNDQYIAVLSKGDTVNLKLNIQIQNDGPTKHGYNINTDTKQFVTEKSSQINFVSHSIVNNKSLVSLIVKEIEKHHKEERGAIIVHCKECQHYSDHSSSIEMPPCKCDIVPLSKFLENAEKGCVCFNRDPEVDGDIYSVNAVFSCSSLKRNARVSLVKCPAELSQMESPHPCCHESVLEKQQSNIATKKSVAISDNLHPSMTQIYTIPNRGYCDAQFDIGKDGISQTDWYNVLLEVKREDDGHYTFRLPSLETLKYYNIV